MTEEKFSVYIETPIERTVLRLAGWQSGSCRGLQILVHRFNSGTGLQKCFTVLFRLSSAVEQSAVNRSVACSNQAAGAKNDPTLTVGFFLAFGYLFQAATEGSLFGVDSWRAQIYAVRTLRHEEDPLAGVPNLAAVLILPTLSGGFFIGFRLP